MSPLDIVWGAHVVAGLTALAVFWMTLRKSAALTRPRGRFYVLAMMIVTVTAIMLLLFSRITVGLYAIYVKAPVTSRDAVLAVARATMTAAKYCVLITVDETGQPQARVMQPFEPESDMTVWMGTKRTTRKVEQIRRNPRATLAYYDPESAGSVTLIGSARLVDDLKERKSRFVTGWQSFFPDGPTGNDYLLIRFTADRIEVLSFTQNVATKPFTWRPAILSRQAGDWVVEKP